MNTLLTKFIISLKNANQVSHGVIFIQYNKLILEILNILIKEGYIENYNIVKKNNFKNIVKIILKYNYWWIRKPTFTILKQISTPGKRVFKTYNVLKNFENYHQYVGKFIISTSYGIMSYNKISDLKVGGEILFYIE